MHFRHACMNALYMPFRYALVEWSPRGAGAGNPISSPVTNAGYALWTGIWVHVMVLAICYAVC